MQCCVIVQVFPLTEKHNEKFVRPLHWARPFLWVQLHPALLPRSRRFNSTTPPAIPVDDDVRCRTYTMDRVVFRVSSTFGRVMKIRFRGVKAKAGWGSIAEFTLNDLTDGLVYSPTCSGEYDYDNPLMCLGKQLSALNFPCFPSGRVLSLFCFVTAVCL